MAIHHRHEIEITAPRERVWEVVADVEHWPEWTSSITSVRLIGAPRLELGAQEVIRQPRLPEATWEVIELHPGRSFSWVSTAAGVRTLGGHDLRETDGGTRTSYQSDVEHSGPLAPVAGLLLGRLVRGYLRIEAEGLRRRCERDDEECHDRSRRTT